ncbi:hypothetical protein KI387_020255, partial [Taxus chinensis]
APVTSIIVGHLRVWRKHFEGTRHGHSKRVCWNILELPLFLAIFHTALFPWCSQ